VFDQINRLFVMNNKAQDLSALEFPFKMIRGLLKGGRIISIISASVNNEVSYKSKHPAFVAYDHIASMTGDETLMAFKKLTDEKKKYLLETTGNVPYYVSEVEKKINIEKFLAEQRVDIGSSIKKLLNETKYPIDLKQNVAKMLLGFEFLADPEFYDKKYLLEIEKST
jgi:hypothetical protein